MTGKLAEKLPLTMSSLINTIPDSLYPEEDIPTSMNIFTNTESISHYSQMNAGEMLPCSEMSAAGGNSCLTHLFAWRAVALPGGSVNALFLSIKSANSGSATPLKPQNPPRFYIYSTFRCFFSPFCLEDFRLTLKGKLF